MSPDELRQRAAEDRARVSRSHCVACGSGRTCEAMYRAESYSRSLLR